MTTPPNPIHWKYLLNSTAAKYSGIMDNASTIENAFAVEAVKMYDEGLLIADVPKADDLKLRWFVRQAQVTAKANGQRIRKQFLHADGIQGALNLGTDFDTIITICDMESLNSYFLVEKEYHDGRRTTLGRLNNLDLLLMRESLHRTKIKVEKAWKHLDGLYVHAADELKKYRDYQAFVTATGGVL